VVHKALNREPSQSGPEGIPSPSAAPVASTLTRHSAALVALLRSILAAAVQDQLAISSCTAPHDVFDRYVGIDAVLIEEVDRVDPETLQ
jgi:hypothetical protein